MACWWASGAPTRSELCPPVGLTFPGRAQPSPALTTALAHARPMRQQPPQAAPRHASSHSSEHFGGQVLHHMLALATQPWRLPAPPGRPWALFTQLQMIVTIGCGGINA